MADAPQYRQLLQELVDAIDFQCDPPGGDMSDAGWDQWQAASDTQYEEALKAARAALSAPLSPNSNEGHLTERPGEMKPRTALGARLMEIRARHQASLPPWDDLRVQLVYRMLCDDDSYATAGDEHWEGAIARRIVQALADGVPAAEALPMVADAKCARLELALHSIATLPIPEQDNMPATNMRLIAQVVLASMVAEPLAEAPDEKGNGAAPLADSDLPRLVFEAVGHASRCWTPDGVFDTTEATKCAERLIADVRALYVHTVGAPSDSLSNPTERPAPAVQRPSGDTER